MPIKILRQGLPVIGYAKIGQPTPKDSKMRGAPKKFDHIELTGRERDKDDMLCPDIALMRKIIDAGAKTCGGCPRSEQISLEKGCPTEIPILLPYNDLDLCFPNRLAYFRGSTLFCTGDGENAERREIIGEETARGQTFPIYGEARDYGPCGPGCEDFEKRRCKPSGRLRFVLAGQENVGGCYEWYTTSWNSTANVMESLTMIKQVAGGVLAWIPLVFEISKQTVQPKEGGRASPAWIGRIVFQGGPQSLLQIAHDQLQLRAPLMTEIRKLEASLTRDMDLTPEEIEHIRREFDYENVQAENGIIEGSASSGPEEESAPSPPLTESRPLAPEEPPPLADVDRPPPAPEGAQVWQPPEQEPQPEPEPKLPPFPETITQNHQFDLWTLVKDRAAMFPGKDPAKVAPLLLKEALKQHGYERSADVLRKDFSALCVTVQNAKLPRGA